MGTGGSARAPGRENTAPLVNNGSTYTKNSNVTHKHRRRRCLYSGCPKKGREFGVCYSHRESAGIELTCAHPNCKNKWRDGYDMKCHLHKEKGKAQAPVPDDLHGLLNPSEDMINRPIQESSRPHHVPDAVHPIVALD